MSEPLEIDVVGEYTGNAYPEQREYRVHVYPDGDPGTFMLTVETGDGLVVGRYGLDADFVEGIQRMAGTDHGLSGYEDDWNLPLGMDRRLAWTLQTDLPHHVTLDESQIDEIAQWLADAEQQEGLVTASDDIPLAYVDLRTRLEAVDHITNVDANETNGLVEMWIDPPAVPGTKVHAVANVRMTHESARQLSDKLRGAADHLRLKSPGKTYDHEARPADSAEPGDRCRECGEDVTWTGPGAYDYLHVDDVENR